ncbi:MAG: 7-cyano-7-deazaguanine synthase, partial [Rhodothermia bacterium]|nr:7-cyano-7-deazaguanine synthase [Rhodothermia bacterium]
MIHQRGRPWFRSGNTWVKGFAFYDDTLYSGKAFADLAMHAGPELVDMLPRLRGEFALAHQESNGSYVLAVDRIRSIPLFYSTHPEPAVSDDVDLLASDSAIPEPNDHLKLAFLLQGTTLGNGTLRPGIKQVRAGEAVRLTADGANSTYYFSLAQRRDDLAGLSEDELTRRGTAVIESSFERMLQTAPGPCVVPLSGGLDSRLVAAMLCRHGKKDTVCFSYGDSSSFEAGSSKAVAENLGLQWEFVDYSHAKWNAWASSPEFRTYSDFASQHCAIEHEQDWPAVRQLNRLGVIDEQAMFVPGHSGDFLAGSHLPEAAFGNSHQGAVTDWIMQKYMTQWPTSHVD